MFHVVSSGTGLVLPFDENDKGEREGGQGIEKPPFCLSKGLSCFERRRTSGESPFPSSGPSGRPDKGSGSRVDQWWKGPGPWCMPAFMRE